MLHDSICEKVVPRSTFCKKNVANSIECEASAGGRVRPLICGFKKMFKFSTQFDDVKVFYLL